MVTPAKRHQSLSPSATSSGPLSQRMEAGVARHSTSSSRTDTTRSALIERAGMEARHSRVNSSVMLRILIGRPSRVWSNSKSMAQT